MPASVLTSVLVLAFVFAFSFTAFRPSGFVASTLAFCCGLWLGTAAQAQTGSELRAALAAQFGPLEWKDEHRFPTQCDPLPADQPDPFDAAALEGLNTAPASFIVVEGSVAGIFQGRRRWFINFSDDYSTDFTVSLQNTPLRMIQRLWPSPENWAGQRVRVQGYADIWNGVFIEWDFPQQLCFIDPVPYKR